MESGTLNLYGCSLSLEGVKLGTIRYKAPCIYQMPGCESYIKRCVFRGGGTQKAATSAIFSTMSNLIVENCQFHQFVLGALICDMQKRGLFVFRDNAVISCHECGVYVEG